MAAAYDHSSLLVGEVKTAFSNVGSFRSTTAPLRRDAEVRYRLMLEIWGLMKGSISRRPLADALILRYETKYNQSEDYLSKSLVGAAQSARSYPFGTRKAPKRD